MQQQIEKLIEDIVNDYDQWQSRRNEQKTEIQQRMFEDFKNNHISKGNKFVDWVAAWQTWCRNDAKYNKQKSIDSTQPVELTDYELYGK